MLFKLKQQTRLVNSMRDDDIEKKKVKLIILMINVQGQIFFF